MVRAGSDEVVAIGQLAQHHAVEHWPGIGALVALKDDAELARIGCRDVGCSRGEGYLVPAYAVQAHLVPFQVVDVALLQVSDRGVDDARHDVLLVAHLVGHRQHLAVHGYGVGHGLARIVVGVDLKAMHREGVFLMSCKDWESVGVADVAVGLSHPDVADVGLFGAAHGIVLHLLLAVGTVALHLLHGHLRLGEVALHQLGVVRIIVPHAVAELFGLLQRVAQLLFHVGEVYLGQRVEIHVGVTVYAYAPGDVLQRRQQCRELTSAGVGLDVDVLGIASNARPGGTAYAGGVAVPCALRRGIADEVVLAVERERLVVQPQLYGSSADVVSRLAEAHGQCVVAHASADAPHEVDEGGVGEIVLHGTLEVIGALRGEASAADHGVAVEPGLYIVLADGHGDAVEAVAVGGLQLSVGGDQVAVDVELYALGGDVGAGIVDVSAHGERRHVLEVDVVGRQAGGADEHRAGVGVELVYAQCGGQLVVGAALLEGYTFNNIVALGVGQTVECQEPAVGHGGRRAGIDTHVGMIQLVDAVLTGHVEGIVLDADALVEGPVEYESALRSAEDACVGGVEFLLGEGPLPQSHIVDEAGEGAAAGAVRTADAERDLWLGQRIGCCLADVPLCAGSGHGG